MKLLKPLFYRIRCAVLILTKFDKFYLVGITNKNDYGDISVNEIQFKTKRDYAFFLTDCFEDNINTNIVEDINIYGNDTIN